MKLLTVRSFFRCALILILGLKAFSSFNLYGQTNRPSGEATPPAPRPPPPPATITNLFITNVPVKIIITNLPPFSTNGITNVFSFTNLWITNTLPTLPPPPPPKPWYKRFWDWLWRL